MMHLHCKLSRRKTYRSARYLFPYELFLKCCKNAFSTRITGSLLFIQPVGFTAVVIISSLAGLSPEESTHLNLSRLDSLIPRRGDKFLSCLFLCPPLHCSSHLVCFTKHICTTAKLRKPLPIHQDIGLIRLLVTRNESSSRQNGHVSSRWRDNLPFVCRGSEWWSVRRWQRLEMPPLIVFAASTVIAFYL